MPKALSVIINTYNRRHLVERAISSVARQRTGAVEIVVVDDGSTDGTYEVLRGLQHHIDRVIVQENRGLCSARNSGIAASTGLWVGFLDDDDVLLPGALRAAVELTRSAEAGVICGGMIHRSAKDLRCIYSPPSDHGSILGHRLWNYMPGAFFVRRNLLDEIGGYREELLAQHQTDLALRITDALDRHGLTTAVTVQPFVYIEQQEWADRPLMAPHLMLSGTRNMLEYHREKYETRPARRANLLAIVGVNAARLSETRAARNAFLQAWRLQPRSPRHLARLLLSTTPKAGAWFWGDKSALRVRGRRRRSTAPTIDRAPAQLPAAEQLSNVWNVLPANYLTNPQRSADLAGTPYWQRGVGSMNDRFQEPVYRWTKNVLSELGVERAADVGCGTGRKLVKYISPFVETLGVDQSSAIELARQHWPGHRWLSGDLGDPRLWSTVADFKPNLIVCADVIEHVDDPFDLLRRIESALRHERGFLVLSSPDRDRHLPLRPQGPPGNPRHVREWSLSELEQLLSVVGFEVLRSTHVLPRSYAYTKSEVKRSLWRAAHGLPIPDQRSCMILLARPRR